MTTRAPADPARAERLRSGFAEWHRAQRGRTAWMDGDQMRRRFWREHDAGRTWSESGYLYGYSESYVWMIASGARRKPRAPRTRDRGAGHAAIL